MSQTTTRLLEKNCNELRNYLEDETCCRLFYCADNQGRIVFEKVRIGNSVHDNDRTKEKYIEGDLVNNELKTLTQRRRINEAKYFLYNSLI